MDKTFEQMLREEALKMDELIQDDEAQTEQAAFPRLRIRQASTQAESAPEAAKPGDFYSPNMPIEPFSEAFVVIYKSLNTRALWTKQTGSSAHVFCACQDWAAGYGNVYEQQDGFWLPTETRRDCATCCHNQFRDRMRPPLPPIVGEVSPNGCGNGKVFWGFKLPQDVLETGLKDMTLSQIMPFELTVSSGVFSQMYEKRLDSWNSFTLAMRTMGKRPLPWHSAIVKMATVQLKFTNGSGFQPTFTIARSESGMPMLGAAILPVSRGLVGALQSQAMLTAGSFDDTQPAIPEAPTFTGKQ